MEGNEAGKEGNEATKEGKFWEEVLTLEKQLVLMHIY